MILSASHATGLDTEGRTWAIDPELDKEESEGVLFIWLSDSDRVSVKDWGHLCDFANNEGFSKVVIESDPWVIAIGDIHHSDAVAEAHHIAECLGDGSLLEHIEVEWASWGMLYNNIPQFELEVDA